MGWNDFSSNVVCFGVSLSIADSEAVTFVAQCGKGPNTSAKNLNNRIICFHHCWPNAFARPQDCVDWWVWYHCWISIHRHLNHMLQLGKNVYSLTFAHLVQNTQSHCDPPAKKRKEKKRTPHCLSKFYLT